MSSYGAPAVELAVYRLRMTREDGALLARVQARLDDDDAPRVSIDEDAGVVTFTCDTYEPMLRSRVTYALEAELGPATRDFRAP